MLARADAAPCTACKSARKLEMAFRRQTQSARVPVLKKSAFDLITDPAFPLYHSRKLGFFVKYNNALSE